MFKPNIKKLKEKGDVRGLIKALGCQSDWHIRADAAVALGGMNCKDAIDALLPLLRDNEDQVQLEANNALKKIGWIPRNDEQKVNVYIIQKEWGALIDMGEKAVPFIIEHLGRDDERLIQTLTYILAEIGAPAVGPLLKALDRSDEELVNNCIDVLGELGDDRALPKLHKMCNISLPHVGHAFLALSYIGSPESTNLIFELVKMASKGDQSVPFIAALTRIGDNRIANEVVRMVRDKATTNSKRTALLYLLLSLKDERAPDMVLEFSGQMENTLILFTKEFLVSWALEKKGRPKSDIELYFHKPKLRKKDLTDLKSISPNKRALAAEALGKTGDNEAVIPLIEQLNVEKDERPIINIIEALGELKDSKAVTAIIKFSKHPEESIRLSVVMALSNMDLKDPTVEQVVIAALDEEDQTFREVAITNLMNIGGPASVDSLARTLCDEDMWIRSASAEALGGIDDPRTVELLANALEDTFGIVRGSAVEFLGFKKNSKCFELISSRLTDQNAYVRRMAVGSLAQLGDRRAVPLLNEMLKDENRFVRRAAVDALGSLGDESCIEHLKKMLNDEPPIARHSKEAIEKIKSKTQTKPSI